MKINRTYKYRLIPTKEQEEKIDLTFNSCNFVKELFVNDRRKGKTEEPIREHLNRYKDTYYFLSEVDSSALINALYKISNSSTVFNPEKERLKKSYSTSKSSYGDSFKILDDKFVYLPRIGNVIFIYHRNLPVNSHVLSATISLEGDGKYYIGISFELVLNAEMKQLNPQKSIGLDYSSTHFIVDSNGERYDHPHFYREAKSRLSKKRSELYKCELNSNNYKKKERKLAKLHHRIVCKRKDYLHKLSTQMAREYDYICVEDINLAELSNQSVLKDATKDNSYGEFVKMLDYKTTQQGKRLIKVDRWYPSTRTCNVCGKLGPKLSLGTKQWVCQYCGSLLDRDINAAINIRREGMKNIPSIGR